MSGDVMIQCENLIKIYRLDGGGGETAEVQALQGLDLTVLRGEMIGVVGASGSGKSTLLNILGGLDRPTGGRAVVDRRDLGRLTELELDSYRREFVGFVWQQGSRNLIPYLTAQENVRLPLVLSGRVDPAAKSRPAELLDRVGLGERAGHRLEELSGGEQQRVAVAIALANEPRLLLADEPTGELDTATAAGIYDLLRSLNRDLGLTIVIVSHDSGIAARVDRVVAVRDGKLASEMVRKTVRVQGEAGHEEKHHVEELLVLDSAGRLQIPREHLDAMGIRRRVRLELTDDGILLRRPEGEEPPAEERPHAARAEETGVDEPPPPEWKDLPAWRDVLARAKEIIRSVVRRLKAPPPDGNPQDGES
jgi:ABC-type lipoprotein export system ATPase subunit/bifunctional DNA-binding transcriptional regulator/antitoxin component of YhaV-PrlF toxin-antitoxin module